MGAVLLIFLIYILSRVDRAITATLWKTVLCKNLKLFATEEETQFDQISLGLHHNTSVVGWFNLSVGCLGDIMTVDSSIHSILTSDNHGKSEIPRPRVNCMDLLY